VRRCRVRSVATHAFERLGARLVYDVIGEGATTIVVPGGPGFGSTYLRDSIVSLAHSRRLVFIDQRGSGRSSGDERPHELTMQTLVDDLDATRAETSADSIDLIGHSFGGLQCLFYALANPNKVRRLALIDSDPPTAVEWRRYREVLAERDDEERNAILQSIESQPGWQTNPDSLETYFRTYVRPYFARPERVSRLHFGFGPDSFEKLTVTTRAIREDLGEWDIREALRTLTIPTLVIYGSDTIFPALAVESTIRSLPNARLEVMANVGHFPFLEDQPTFLTLVEDFLSAI
jgi:proline iminopeptidase